VRIYTEASEETLRARKLLTQWTDDGDLSKEQYQRLEQESASDLRTTNIFLRLVLFFFTAIAVGAAVGLFFMIFLNPAPSQQTTGIFFLIFAAVSYAAAEVAVSQARLYRYGIEEALAVCSVAFLCAGLGFTFFSSFSQSSSEIQLVIPAVGALASLWVWYRFNLWYAFPAAMIFAIFLPGAWTTSHSAQHAFIAAFYAAGLIGIAPVRARHRFDYLEEAYSLSEAFLWLGIYLTFNLKISDFSLLSHWGSPTRFTSESATPFYWATWVLIWCLPPLILTRGVRRKDRFVLAVGAITAVLTLVTNKPYLGWQRHTWDPMLLGIALTGVALLLRRWLARGPGGVRHGFTAARLSRKDKHAMSVGSAVLGLTTPQSITPPPQTTNPDFRFGGGGSGGGGASGDF
jgi:membrane protein YdbS with pleckstrin-like domain